MLPEMSYRFLHEPNVQFLVLKKFFVFHGFMVQYGAFRPGFFRE